MRTKEEIRKEIAELRKMQPNVRPYTIFGDDNHAAIDAQIDVLEKVLEGSDVEDILDANTPENLESGGAWTQSDYDAATYIREWLEGEDESPSESWRPLVRN